MRQIIKILPKQRQTMLFSATQTTKVEDLARISFQAGTFPLGRTHAHPHACRPSPSPAP